MSESNMLESEVMQKEGEREKASRSPCFYRQSLKIAPVPAPILRFGVLHIDAGGVDGQNAIQNFADASR